MDELKEIIAKNLVLYRTKAKLSQIELAQKINYSDKSISKWERGMGTPDAFVLKQLADLYEIKIDDFFVDNCKMDKLEKSETKTPQDTKNNNSKHLLITLLSCGLVWLVATLAFVILSWIKVPNAYISFITALPVCAIVLIVFSRIWWKYYLVGVYTSVLIWTIALLMNVIFNFQNINLVYIICIPLQILIIMWVILRYIKKRQVK